MSVIRMPSPEKPSFEDRLFRQQAYWVAALTVDALNYSVVLSLIADPDTSEVDGVVTFEQCRSFRGTDIRDDDEKEYEKYTPTLLGIQDMNEAGETRYVITTDTVELSFTTSAEPQVQWADPNKPKITWKSERLLQDLS